MSMKLRILLFLLAGCLNTAPEAGPDAGASDVTTPDAKICQSVVLQCGPRPPRPVDPTSEEHKIWSHDIDLWAKCAEWAP